MQLIQDTKLSRETEEDIQSFAERVQPIFKYLDFEWENNGVPTIDMIVERTRYLIANIGDHGCIERGGIIVRRFDDFLEFGLYIDGGMVT